MIGLKILGIDTSGKTASVAVLSESRLLGEITYLTKLTHSQVILPLASELLTRLELSLEDIDCIAVSEGPGSYTGLRIGISAVKGICFDGKTKCMGISTLEALAKNVSFFDGIIVSVLHARPEIAYFGAYRSENGVLTAVCEDCVCGYDRISKFVRSVSQKVMLVGDICEKLKSELFAELENVLVAPVSQRLQRASSLCEIAADNTDKWTDCEALDARYLQITKAEKDLKK